MARKLTKAVGALDMKEVEGIIIFDKTDQLCDIVYLSTLWKFPERFPWKNDPLAMEKIKKEIDCTPFKFVVLFFIEE